MMSVETPWPAAVEPESSRITLASPSASWPPVTASMRNSRRRASRARGGVDRAEDRVDRAVAGEVAADALALGREDRDRRVRRAPGRGLDVEPLERVGARVGAELVGDERLEVHRGDLLLLVRDLLEALERLVERLAGDLVAQVHQRRLQRVAAGVLAEHDRVRVVEADGLGGHDLVGRALLEHAVLVDAGLVLERVAAHDGLVGLHDVAGQAARRAGWCARSRAC